MRIAIIGRSELMYDTALKAAESGHEIVLVVTAKEAPEYKVTSSDFEALATKQNAIFINSAKINSAENLKLIKSLETIDIALSINYSGIIEQNVIDLFRLGILNAHGGDLPRYRGNACMAWAIINGESRVGLCIHRMLGGELDSGDIIVRQFHPVTIETKVGQLFEWMHKEIPSMMMQAVDLLKNDSNFILERQSKNPKDALRTYPRLPEDGKIDWTKSNVEIVQLINASGKPFAGAYCDLDGKKLIIWSARICIDDEQYLAVPGQVCSINHSNGEITVIAGNGKLVVELVSCENKTAVPSEFLRSLRQRFR